MKKQIEDYIFNILKKHFPDDATAIYEKSELMQYFNLKSGAIHGDAKSRRSYANWYAIYSILSFYEKEGFVDNKEIYSKFEGFQYTQLFNFMRTLYGGSKLQNHALNSRVNGEFTNKIAKDKGKQLILINDNKYLINPSYLYIDNKDLTRVYIEIVEKYMALLVEKDDSLFLTLQRVKQIDNIESQKNEIKSLITVDSEARIFEIISYTILANHYKKTKVYFGYSPNELEEYYLQLYKTGRTNANDGGIDFVMKPIGRFFQVTEVDKYNKYFLDIDKVLKFPITFVVKTEQTSDEIYAQLLNYAEIKSGGHEIIKSKYINAIEEVITINELINWLDLLSKNEIKQLIDDIDTYYRLELNIDI